MLFRDIFHVYGKLNSFKDVLKYALKSQPDFKFQQKYGSQADLFLKLIQTQLQEITSDPEWVRAKTLSDRIREQHLPSSALKNTKKSASTLTGTMSKRGFSTFAKLSHENNENNKKVCYYNGQTSMTI